MAPLRTERADDGVALLTLDLPERRNAMTEELTAAWAEAIPALAADPRVRCVVVTGAGSAFCAGGDLSWLAEGGELGVDDAPCPDAPVLPDLVERPGPRGADRSRR